MMTMTVAPTRPHAALQKAVAQPRLSLVLMPVSWDYCTTYPALPRKAVVYDLAEMKEKRHGHKVQLESVAALKREIERYKANFQPKPLRKTVLPKQESPEHSELNLCLNKLTPVTFDDVLARIKELIPKMPMFTEYFVAKVIELGVCQMAFVPMYVTMAQEVAKVVGDRVKECLEETAFEERKNTTGHMYLLGCLAAAGLISLERVFELLKRLAEEETEESLVDLFYLAMNAGKAVEAKFPEAADVFDSLKHLKKEHKFMVQVYLSDLLEARENGWRTENLMPKIYASKSEDAHDDAIEANGMRILQEYIHEQTLHRYFSPRMARDVMIAMAMGTPKLFREASNIFAEIEQKKYLTGKNARDALQETLKTVSDKEILVDCPRAVMNCGAIFALLVKAGLCQFTLFGNGAVFPFEPSFFRGFLMEAEVQNMYDMVCESPWMAQLRFMPAIFSHLKMTLLMSESDMITCWPAYDAMACISQAMNDGAQPDEVKEIIENEIEESIVNSLQFAQFATEMIVMWKPQEYLPVFLSVVRKHIDKSLYHIERIGQLHHWTIMEIAREIAGLADCLDYNIANWKVNYGSTLHMQVVKQLQRRVTKVEGLD